MKTQIILTKAGEVAMIVHDAADASDAAWNPPDCTRVEIDKSEYDAVTNGELYSAPGEFELPILKLVEAAITDADAKTATAARIAAIEAEIAAKKDGTGIALVLI